MPEKNVDCLTRNRRLQKSSCSCPPTFCL